VPRNCLSGASCRCCPAQTAPSYNSTHAHSYTHLHTHLPTRDTPCTSCLMDKDKDKDKYCHLLPACTPETAEPAPTAHASQASPRALVPACPRLPQLHLTRRLASRCKESSDVPTPPPVYFAKPCPAPGTWVRRPLAEFNPRTLAHPPTRAPPSTDSQAAFRHWTELAPCVLGNPLVSRHMQVVSRTRR
jgi:hypothetical protein